MPRVVESVAHPHRPDVPIFGFSALASASARVVLSTGRPDYGLVRDEVLAHPRSLSAATDLPVNADFPASAPTSTICLRACGWPSKRVGRGWRPRFRRESEQAYSVDRAVERVRAARNAIDRTGEDVILVARTETLLVDPSTISLAIDKLVAFADAGADGRDDARV